MRAVEVLEEYKARVGELEALQEEITRTLGVLTGMSETFIVYGANAQKITDKCAELIVKYGEQLEDVEEAIDSLEAAHKDALKAINRLDNPAHREILRWVYLNGMTLYEAALRLEKRQGIAMKTTYNRHDIALSMLDSLIS